MMQKRFSLGLVLSLGALSALSAGCEVSTCTGDDCDFGDGDGSLFDGDDFDGDDDGSDGNGDGTDDGSDGTDLDAGTDGDAGDGDGSDGDAGELTLQEFCEAFNAKALAWATKLNECCLSSDAPDADRSFEAAEILTLFGYADGATDGCIRANTALIESGDVTFDGSKAAECANDRNLVFPDPPASCPTGEGFPYWDILATVGHGIQAVAQIESCRQTFVGTLVRDEVCPSDSAHLRCVDNLVCRPGIGGELRCQPPLTEETCTDSAQCASGYICAGIDSSTTNRRCVFDTLLAGESCSSSNECPIGQVCDETSSKCDDRPSDLGMSGATQCEPTECVGYCDTETNTCAPLCAAD